MNCRSGLFTPIVAVLSLSNPVDAAIIPLSIINPSFEDASALGDGLGGTFGWTHSPAPGPNGLGAVTTTTPDPTITPPGGAHNGTYFIWGRGSSGASGSASPSGLLQRLNVGAFAPQIDAGFVFANLTAFGLGDDTNNDNFGDFAQMRLTFYDSATGGSVLGTPMTSNVGVAPAWTAMNLDSVGVPVGARSIEVGLFVDRPFGSFNDAGFDDVSGNINVIPEPATFAVWSLLGMCFIGHQWRRKRNARSRRQ